MSSASNSMNGSTRPSSGLAPSAAQAPPPGKRQRLKAGLGRLLRRKLAPSATLIQVGSTGPASSGSTSLGGPKPAIGAPANIPGNSCINTTIAPATSAICNTAAGSPGTTTSVITPSVTNQAVGKLANLGNLINSISPWESALAKLSLDDQQLLGGLEKLDALEKALDAAKEKRDICYQRRWTYTWKGERVVLRDVADKLLTWIEKFKSVGDLAVSFDPSHAALPWAGLRFFLQVAVDDKEKMGVMLMEVEKITNLIGRCAVYERLYLGTGTATTMSPAAVEVAMIELYASILRYLAHAKDYYSKNTAVRMAFSAFDTGGSIFDEIDQGEAVLIKIVSLEESEYHRSQDRALAGQILDVTYRLDKRIVGESENLRKLLSQFYKPITRIQADVRDIKDNLKDTERINILMFLSQVEYETHHKTAKEDRIEGTGGWLLRKDAFLQWQKSSASTILWLHGIPGAGKTKLTSMVIDNTLQRQEEPANDEVLAYFYCKRDATGSTDPDLIMSSIVKQLCCLRLGSDLPLRAEVVKLYDARKKSGFSAGSLRFQESLELIISLVNSYPHTTIVIDALDECDPKKRHKLLKSLKYIIDHSSSLVKIFVSSRDDDDIVLKLEKVPNLRIETRDNTEDIEKFVRQEIIRSEEEKQFLRGKPSQKLKNDVIRTLVNGSQGMFLWARLQIEEVLSGSTEGDVRERLGKLPKGLEGTYTEIYTRIESEPGKGPELARKALIFVMCSYQPCSPDELAALVSLGFAEEYKVDGDVLFKLCYNLLTLDHQSNSVKFAHLSVREFLEKGHCSIVDAHITVAKLCLSHLGSSNALGSINCNDYSTVYPVIFGPMHVQLCLDQKDDTELLNLLVKFLKELSGDWYEAYRALVKSSSWRFHNVQGTDIGSILQAFDEDLSFSPLSPLHVASVYGFTEQIMPLWQSEPLEIGARNNNGHQILAIVARRGYTWIVEALLRRGADINAQNDNYGGALHAAVNSKHDRIVELLLVNGADANAQGRGAGSALQAAALLGHDRIVELLLANGADVSTQDEIYGSALQVAVEGRHKRVVELLLEKEVDFNAEGGMNGGALRSACLFGYDEIVELLLVNGVDVNAQSESSGSALQLASFSGHDRIVELLLINGADVTAQSELYGSALEAAVIQGHGRIAELLLINGGDVNAQTEGFGSALQAAVIGAHESMVELLIVNGADVNAQGGIYGSALQLAASRGQERMVELLLKEGSKVGGMGAPEQQLCIGKTPQGRSTV